MTGPREQEWSLASFKRVLLARRNTLLRFCRFGVIRLATTVAMLALGQFAAEAGLAAQTKHPRPQSAQSKDQHARRLLLQLGHPEPAKSKGGHGQRTQSKDRDVQRLKDQHATAVPAKARHDQATEFRNGHIEPKQCKDHPLAPKQSKEVHIHRSTNCHAADHYTPNPVLHGPDFHPAYADILIDDNTGQVLHESSPDSPRHPASLTKIMTLYLLFEQLEAKALSLDSRLRVSPHASAQAPTKLGLKPDETITIEDAIKAVVTRSANDAAVVIAEAIAGSEADFAALMTHKAQALGMANTVYVNASGLPAESQITTAREQSLLGHAIQERFPEYSRYFAIPSFQYHGVHISNHNALLREMQGVDGIKTGYTEASGYNLVASLRRDGRHLIGVVLGERSNVARDARMRRLIEDHLSKAAPNRVAPSIVLPVQDLSP